MGILFTSTFNILEYLHLNAAWLIHKLPSEIPETDVLDLVKWKPLVNIHKRRLASIMYQVYHDSSPDQFVSLVETRNINTSFNLRRLNHSCMYRTITIALGSFDDDAGGKENVTWK